MGVRGKDKRTSENKSKLLQYNENAIKYNQLEWIIIDGIKTDYIVSSNGIVYSIKKNKIHIIKPFLTKDAHLRLGLKVNEKNIKKYIHVLVAQAFIPNPENKPFIHHKDGDPMNNHYENLLWVTKEEHDELTSGLNQYVGTNGSLNPSSKFTDEQIEHALQLMEENKLYPDEICDTCKISYSTFQHLRFREESWKYLKDKYNIDGYNKFRRATYTLEQKMEFIDLRRSNPELTLKSISKILNVPYTNIKQWNQLYRDQIAA